MIQVGRLWRTIRHLTVQQIGYQLLHRLRKPARLHVRKTIPASHFIAVPVANKPISWQNDSFTFLNRTVHVGSQLDWNYNAMGKLWTYNLAYFDYLNQPDMQPAVGLRLMRNFASQTTLIKTGLEAYPTSIRIINWVHFLSRHRIQDDEINCHLAAQVKLLSRRLEYHLSGNHLLENGFALLIGALYFQQKQWYKRAVHLVKEELTAQILPDGGHYERSPIYHQLLLDRLLEVHLALQSETTFFDAPLLNFLTVTASRMRCWLNHVTFRNGDVPMMNDSPHSVAPSTAQLRHKARISLPSGSVTNIPLTESGYRMVRRDRYELLVNVGTVGPPHQPGHVHADTFSFVLYVDNQPVIVDTGTSTYALGECREWERSTMSHNTVTINENNSSEVWASFRVGRRAQVKMLTDLPTIIKAQHNGYQHLGYLHERTWCVNTTNVLITDQLLGKQSTRKAASAGVARFYFHPSINVICFGDTIQAGPVKISFQSATKPKFTVTTKQIADGFNQTQGGCCLEVIFTTTLETSVTISG